MYSRRGTGYYKVPSLIGVWNRSALMHSGYVTSLEEMFNPARLKDDFIPSGFNPNVEKPFAVKGTHLVYTSMKKIKSPAGICKIIINYKHENVQPPTFSN